MPIDRFPSPMWLLVALSFAGCGIHADAPQQEEVAQRFDPIMGGTLDTDTAHDGVVYLYSAQTGGACTGAIISQPGQRGVVLTARHCVSKPIHNTVTCQDDVGEDYQPSRVYVFKGTAAKDDKELLGYGAEFFHTGGASLCGADIALMVMAHSVSGVEPLRVRIDPSAYHIGEQFTAFGYGLTLPDDYHSAGRRYRREGVSVTAFGPNIPGVFDAEFLGTDSICSGDSGGPAVSSQYGIVGVASRGGNCSGNTNIWVRPDGFRNLLDAAMVFANSHYRDENGTLQPGGGTGGEESGVVAADAGGTRQAPAQATQGDFSAEASCSVSRPASRNFGRVAALLFALGALAIRRRQARQP